MQRCWPGAERTTVGLLLICGVLGLLLATWTARMLNKYRLARHFFYPPLVFVSLAVIYTVLIGTFIIRA